MLYRITCFLDIFAPLHRVHPVTSPPPQDFSKKISKVDYKVQQAVIRFAALDIGCQFYKFSLLCI